MPSGKPRIKHAEIVGQFAARLKEIRRSRGMTQTELATRSQVTPSYIGRLEASGASPGIDLVERLAKSLGTTLSELLPSGPQPDTMGVLREQAKQVFESVLKNADRETLLMLNPLLARLSEASPRRR